MVVPTQALLDLACLPSMVDLIALNAHASEDLLPRNPRSAADAHLPEMIDFVHTVAERARLRPAVLAVTLIYIRRLKPCLPQGSRGDYDAPYRIFVAAALTACKYLIDTGLRNETMSRATRGIFNARDVSRAERTFLRLVGYRLWVEPEELAYLDTTSALDSRVIDTAAALPLSMPLPIPVVVRAMRSSAATAADSFETASVMSSLSDTDSAYETMDETMTATVIPKNPVPLMLNRLV